MKTEMITVGTELLMGYITDTNSNVVAQELLDIGLGMYYRQVVGDNPERIKEALEIASKRSDLIILSGGIGPTQDDITKQVVAEFVGDELIEDEVQLEKVKRYFQEKNRELTENIYRQTLTFSQGTTFYNDVGLACGAVYQHQRKEGALQQFILLPGPPHELKQMFSQYAKPYIQEQILEDIVIESHYLNFSEIGESTVANILEEMISSQSNPTIAMYAQPRKVVIRLTANASDSTQAKALNQHVAQQILEELSTYFIGYGETQTIENHIVDLLKEKGSTLSVIENITGGFIMESLTEVSGVSEVFQGGIIAYSEEAYGRLLNIDQLNTLLERAVGCATHCRMKCETDIGLSVLGRQQSETTKPYGSWEVCIAVSVKDGRDQTKILEVNDRPYSVLKEMVKSDALTLLKKTVM